MSQADATTDTAQLDPETELARGYHHIGVQTSDLDNSIEWYRAFFGAALGWRLETFSPLSRQRLPAMRELVELSVGGVRFHLFDSATGESAPPPEQVNQYQHVCFAATTPETLRAWRDRWFRLYLSGAYTYARDEPATDIDTDIAGMQSFYFYDVNGLEFEFSYFPPDT